LDADIQFIRDATVGADSDRYAAAYYPTLISSYAHTYDFDNLTVDAYTLAAGATASVAIAAGDKMSKFAGSVFYNKVQALLNNEWVVLPPSGAIAGLYTRVDNTKGVWKAPANEAVLSVVAPYIDISSRQQENLNVDPDSGKSINVIRTFPGYGTLVWGARTLNGNDNEWKYISVRRFFNMVEESIKKSSQWAVFEPNTISTWVKISAMIENYLFVKWRDGALAGSKPEQAFYVRVGLGTTMTATDILEGRMNIEIGMAVARPAEFIVLKFTQLMQQS
jgi:phage tail sheath protein FI